ncbi:Hypothetical protein FKW44_024285, partial [Caligus rogercresseyi]
MTAQRFVLPWWVLRFEITDVGTRGVKGGGINPDPPTLDDEAGRAAIIAMRTMSEEEEITPDEIKGLIDSSRQKRK